MVLPRNPLMDRLRATTGQPGPEEIQAGASVPHPLDARFRRPDARPGMGIGSLLTPGAGSSGARPTTRSSLDMLNDRVGRTPDYLPNMRDRTAQGVIASGIQSLPEGVRRVGGGALRHVAAIAEPFMLLQDALFGVIVGGMTGTMMERFRRLNLVDYLPYGQAPERIASGDEFFSALGFDEVTSSWLGLGADLLVDPLVFGSWIRVAGKLSRVEKLVEVGNTLDRALSPAGLAAGARKASPRLAQFLDNRVEGILSTVRNPNSTFGPIRSAGRFIDRALSPILGERQRDALRFGSDPARRFAASAREAQIFSRASRQQLVESLQVALHGGDTPQAHFLQASLKNLEEIPKAFEESLGKLADPMMRDVAERHAYELILSVPERTDKHTGSLVGGKQGFGVLNIMDELEAGRITTVSLGDLNPLVDDVLRQVRSALPESVLTEIRSTTGYQGAQDRLARSREELSRIARDRAQSLGLTPDDAFAFEASAMRAYNAYVGNILIINMAQAVLASGHTFIQKTFSTRAADLTGNADTANALWTRALATGILGGGKGLEELKPLSTDLPLRVPDPPSQGTVPNQTPTTAPSTPTAATPAPPAAVQGPTTPRPVPTPTQAAAGATAPMPASTVPVASSTVQPSSATTVDQRQAFRDAITEEIARVGKIMEERAGLQAYVDRGNALLTSVYKFRDVLADQAWRYIDVAGVDKGAWAKGRTSTQKVVMEYRSLLNRMARDLKQGNVANIDAKVVSRIYQLEDLLTKQLGRYSDVLAGARAQMGGGLTGAPPVARSADELGPAARGAVDDTGRFRREQPVVQEPTDGPIDRRDVQRPNEVGYDRRPGYERLQERVDPALPQGAVPARIPTQAARGANFSPAQQAQFIDNAIAATRGAMDEITAFRNFRKAFDDPARAREVAQGWLRQPAVRQGLQEAGEAAVRGQRAAPSPAPVSSDPRVQRLRDEHAAQKRDFDEAMQLADDNARAAREMGQDAIHVNAHLHEKRVLQQQWRAVDDAHTRALAKLGVTRHAEAVPDTAVREAAEAELRAAQAERAALADDLRALREEAATAASGTRKRGPVATEFPKGHFSDNPLFDMAGITIRDVTPAVKRLRGQAGKMPAKWRNAPEYIPDNQPMHMGPDGVVRVADDIEVQPVLDGTDLAATRQRLWRQVKLAEAQVLSVGGANAAEMTAALQQRLENFNAALKSLEDNGRLSAEAYLADELSVAMYDLLAWVGDGAVPVRDGIRGELANQIAARIDDLDQYMLRDADVTEAFLLDRALINDTDIADPVSTWFIRDAEVPANLLPAQPRGVAPGRPAPTPQGAPQPAPQAIPTVGASTTAEDILAARMASGKYASREAALRDPVTFGELFDGSLEMQALNFGDTLAGYLNGYMRRSYGIFNDTKDFNRFMDALRHGQIVPSRVIDNTNLETLMPGFEREVKLIRAYETALQAGGRGVILKSNRIAEHLLASGITPGRVRETMKEMVVALNKNNPEMQQFMQHMDEVVPKFLRPLEQGSTAAERAAQVSDVPVLVNTRLYEMKDEIPQEMLEALAEYASGSLATAEAVDTAGRVLQRQEVFQRAYADGVEFGYVRVAPHTDDLGVVFREVPRDLRAMGSFAGKYVHPYFLDKLRELAAIDKQYLPAALNRFRSLVSAGKLASPRTAAANFMGGFLQAAHVGINPLVMMKRLLSTFKDADSLARGMPNDLVRELQRNLNLEVTSMRFDEFVDELRKLRIDDYGTGPNGVQRMGSDLADIYEKFLNRPLGSRFLGLSGFQFIENWFKIAGYVEMKARLTRRAGGKAVSGRIDPDVLRAGDGLEGAIQIEKQAAEFARTIVYDYSELPPMLKFLRKTGLVMFPGFPYFLMKSTLNAMMHRPGAIAVANRIPEAFMNASLSTEEQMLLWYAMDEWMREDSGVPLPFSVRYDDNGNVTTRVIPLDQLIPNKTILDSFGSAQQNNPWLDSVAGLGVWGPLFEIVNALATGDGEAPLTGKFGHRVWDFSSEGTQRISDIVRFFYNTHAPTNVADMVRPGYDGTWKGLIPSAAQWVQSHSVPIDNEAMQNLHDFQDANFRGPQAQFADEFVRTIIRSPRAYTLTGPLEDVSRQFTRERSNVTRFISDLRPKAERALAAGDHAEVARLESIAQQKIAEFDKKWGGFREFYNQHVRPGGGGTR